MLISVNDASVNTDDIIFINTAYKVMGLYEIDIYIKSQEDPIVLQYNEKENYDSMVEYLTSKISIANIS